MKVFLFLYPIREYVDSCIENFQCFEHQGCDPKRLNEIITARYRSKGYQIHWLFFSDPDDLALPNLSRTSEHIKIEDKDIVLACGVSFEDHVANKTYPDNSHIVERLTAPIERLVIGGFHQNDCVDKVASTAYAAGISTFVDEDTTEFFYTSGSRKIPLVRREFTLRGFGVRDPFWVNLILEKRKDRPWLTQLP